MSSDLSWELVVVDNASTDGSAEKSTELCPEAVVIANDRNSGFAAACNQGAAAAHGEYLLFLNPDVQPDAGSSEEMVAVLAAREKAGLVSARLRNPDGSFQATSRRFPTISNLLFSRRSVFHHLFGGAVDKRERYTLADFQVITEVPAVAAAMVMVRKTLFDSLGGFDTRFFMYLEDTDLSLRVQEAGYINLVVPSAGGIHFWGMGSATGELRRGWLHHRSLWRYFLKHYPNGFSVFVLPLLLLANLLLASILPQRKTGEL